MPRKRTKTKKEKDRSKAQTLKQMLKALEDQDKKQGRK